jgi:hypothetical protein
MATLNSPGVSVSVIDESFYTPATPGTVPLIVMASAANKSNASGTGTAQGTLEANAGTVYIITSQRDLTDTFGTPLFYTDTSGNPIHAGEQNEYGLQAAYSLLGASSRAYVVRANLDLTQLSPQSSAPTGTPTAGTYWLDTANTLFGINEWNASGNGSFTVKTPKIIDNTNMDTAATNGVPNDSFGIQGDYAVYVTSDNSIVLYYKTTASSNAWVEVHQGFNGGKQLQISPHTSYPTWTNSTPTGSVWIKTTTPGYGADYVVKYYNGTTQTWSTVAAPIYTSTLAADTALDSAGGKNIKVGTLFVESDTAHAVSTSSSYTADFKVWRRAAAGATVVNLPTTTTINSSASVFTLRETLAGSAAWGSNITVNVAGSTSTTVAAQIAQAINTTAGLTNVSASYNATTNVLTITHAAGGEIELADGSNSPLNTAISNLTPYDPIAQTGVPYLNSAPAGDMYTGVDSYDYLISNWSPLTYVAQTSAPTNTPADGTLWYSAVHDQVDIMIHDGQKWVGYLNQYPSTDPNGPIVSATQPTVQSDGSALEANDIWISTADLEMYGKDIYVYDSSNWILQDVTDHTSPNGWVFGDARWATTGQATDPATVLALLNSNYVDPDAPDPSVYPRGTRLWNTRRSGFNVKQYQTGYINVNANGGLNIRYQNDVMNGPTPYFTDRWVTVGGNNEDGSGKFGRHAQRGVVVSALKSLIDTNQAIRDTDTLNYNLIACPGYPEAISNLVGLNTDRGQTAFVVGDTPFRLKANATDLTAWGSNANLAYDNGDVGAVTHDDYLGLFYPSGYTTDNSGNNIVVPPSHMMLRTIINSDAKSYQWYAPAGTRRGGVDNASSVGYVDEATGQFNTVSLYQGLRDVMAQSTVQINPIATLPGAGLTNFGQLTRAASASALDRINVARLIGYLRYQLTVMAKPFLFEPNDAQTRKEIKAAADSLLLELVGLRGIYDFITVCDTTNNTPARIDRSELWLDIAIEPVKAVEFIYIPLRIVNTGAIAAGTY